MGRELVLAGLGGCFMSNLLATIRSREAEVCNVRTGVIATVDGNPGRFTAVDLHVSADCDDPEQFEKLLTIAERRCIAVNTMPASASGPIAAPAPPL